MRGFATSRRECRWLGGHFPAEMSAFKSHIESDGCLLDPRLIDLSFSAVPRAASGEAARPKNFHGSGAGGGNEKAPQPIQPRLVGDKVDDAGRSKAGVA